MRGETVENQIPWDEERLSQVEKSAHQCYDACRADVISLVAEVRRLRGMPLLRDGNIRVDHTTQGTRIYIEGWADTSESSRQMVAAYQRGETRLRVSLESS